MPTRLVADVGGTNSRIALYDSHADEFRGLRQYINRDFGEFQDVVSDWLAGLDEATPAEGCIAIAAVPCGDRIAMSNMDWSFSCQELAAQFGFSRFGWVNDFEANAYALPYLGNADRKEVVAGVGQPWGDTLATVGPGTGLGGAALIQNPGGLNVARAAEPGHMGLSPGNELELEVFRALLPEYGNIYAELLVSGPGLLRLYQTLAAIRDQPVVATTPAEVAKAALEAEDELCCLALNTFCELLGSICGDFALAQSAYGGLFLAGGILPRMVSFLRASNFHARFCDKGVMRPHLETCPISVLTIEQPGLIGAAHAPF